MVLVGDIVGDDEDAVARATSEVVRIANSRSGEGFVAVSAEARKKFWLDRKRTAAISRHTNAFKINEDVVIPLPRMGEYTDGIERINIELSLRNKLAWRRAGGLLPAPRQPAAGQDRRRQRDPSAELLEDRVQQALALVREVRALWQWAGCDEVARAAAVPAAAGPQPARQLEDADPAPLQHLCGRRLRAHAGRVHAHPPARCSGRVWVALHMHAGDGNVHTNIPVNSDNYAMLQTAHEAVGRIMALARSLGGVISGEHGIGITKLEFLTDDELALCRLQAPRRPRGPLQQGQAAARRQRSSEPGPTPRCMPT
jgi:FAD/FMN-containing dehydrogenase